MAKLKKNELIALLVDTYGYEKDDIKLLTNAKLEGLIKLEEADAERAERDETLIQAEEQTIADNDMIVVMNGLSGALTHRSAMLNRTWEFTEFGQTQKMPYSELLDLNNRNPKVFKDGWLIVMNRQVQDEFGLTDLYQHILTPDTLDSVFRQTPEELEGLIRNLPRGMKETFIVKARELYQSRKLDSVRVKDLIEQTFNVSLDDNSVLSDIIRG